MKELLFVGLGGFFGSVFRYGIAIIFSKHLELAFQVSTLIVNLVGSFLIGILAAVLTKSPSHLNLILMVGFCGGFTTFSTFSLDGLKLLRQNLFFDFFLYASISMIGGLTLCYLGYYFSSRSLS